ncbi:MAG TPA: ASCH domain-containing protein, partial [Nitrososphaeraceae archaeon]|nr:ASCH domain-containing protein [Nitrososphaeraceae archaeon]
MKCLSLKQPYTEPLVSGKKTIELRNWNTSFRGKFLVHASKNIDKERLDFLALIIILYIGPALLYDVKQYRNKIELELDKNKHLAD